MKLTIAYCTSRKEPKFEWFEHSLARQIGSSCLDIIVVEGYASNDKTEPIQRHLKVFSAFDPHFQNRPSGKALIA